MPNAQVQFRIQLEKIFKRQIIQYLVNLEMFFLRFQFGLVSSFHRKLETKVAGSLLAFPAIGRLKLSRETVSVFLVRQLVRCQDLRRQIELLDF